MATVVRAMQLGELDWVNEQYQSIGFVPTDLRDRQFIAGIERKKAGLGRLAYITDEVWELGGIYVIPEFRGQSVAREIVRHLLLQAGNVQLYCIPFTNLGKFYQKMGFVQCSNINNITKKIRQKYQWCQRTYPQGVLLLERCLS